MAAEHDCAAPGCPKRIGQEHLMCVPHWTALPGDIQREVWRSWRNIHRDRPGYLEAREKAVEWHRVNGSGRQGGLF